MNDGDGQASRKSRMKGGNELSTHIVVSPVEQRVDGFDEVVNVICLL